MKLNDMKFKSLLFGGLALALAACSSEEIQNPGNVDVNPTPTPESTLKTAKVLVGQWGQNRVTNVDTWSLPKTRGEEDWEEKLNFTIPEGAVDITAQNYDQNAHIYYVPEGFEGEINANWNNGNYEFYNFGTVTAINGNFNDNITIYNAGTLGYLPTSGKYDIYNRGDLTLSNYANLVNLYNIGNISFEKAHNPWWPGEVGGFADIPNTVNIYSKGGVLEFPDGVDLKANCEINSIIYVSGNKLNIQSGTIKTICGIVYDGTITVPNTGLVTSYIKAKELIFNGHPIKLLPNALIDVEILRMETNASNDKFESSTDSKAIIKAKDIYFDNGCGFETSFSSNIDFQITGNVYDKFQGLKSWSIQQYLEVMAGDNLKSRFITGEINYTPSCGAEAETPDTEQKIPTLEVITSMEAPGHDHNEDKTEGMRHLSATSIDYRDGIVYVSYHMRGANWGTGVEDYDHDDTEGCIETWQFAENDLNQTVIELGKYMWTYDFDFNHIVLDGSDIIAMGHQNKMGGIIGKLNNEFHDFNPSLDGGLTSSTEFKYQLLKTDEGVYDDFVNESGNSSNQLVDYKSVGDVNCLVKIGDNYFFTASGGYGKINSDLDQYTRLTRGTDFIVTDGSAKHIIKKNDNEVALIYLDTRPESTATAESSATLATVASSTFPIGASTTPLSSVISPVDGKNVLAWNGSDMFACMGRGGLNVGNTIYNFGEDGKEPVNGIDMDDKYIYLAVGSHLRVLDINNPNNQIVSYHLPDMSANFVKVVEYNNEKYIIVAYGQAGVKVFRLKNA